MFSKKTKTPKQESINQQSKSRVRYGASQSTIKEKMTPAKMVTPKTCQQLIGMFFKSTNEEFDLIEISEGIFSMCVEFEDISFAKADYSEGSELETLLFKIINYTQTSFELKSEFHKNLAESLL